MYMLKSEPYRKKLRSGDLSYVDTASGHRFYILIARARPVPDKMVFNGYLIYVYAPVKAAHDSGIDLSKRELICAPQFLSSSGWLRGYFNFVKNVPEYEQYIEKEHVFSSCIFSKAGYANEWGESVEPRPDSLMFALGSHCTLDYDIAEYMGWDLDSAGVE